MRILLALYFIFTQATAQVVPQPAMPAATNYILPSMQATAPWGAGYGFGGIRPPIYGSGLPSAYPAPGLQRWGLGGSAQPFPWTLGGPRFPGYPMAGPMLPPQPQQQNGLGSLLALGLPLFAQMFGGGLTTSTPTPVGVDDCESCRSIRSSPVVRRLSPPQPAPEDDARVTEARVPVAQVAAAVPSVPRAIVPTSAPTSTARVDRVATTEPEAAPSPVPAAVSRPAVATAAAVVRRQSPRGIVTRKVPASPAELLVVRARTQGERRSQSAPVWNTFINNFKICAPGCVPDDYGTYGSRGNRSCHPSGRAIDIHGMICNGRKYRAIDNQPEFRRMVQCMESAPGNRNKSQRPVATVRGLLPMRTLYQNKSRAVYGATLGHYDHAHFSITCFNGRVW